MDDVSVRPAVAEDASDVRRVARESWHAAYDDVLGAGRVESVVDSWYELDGLRESVEREDGRFLVAEIESGSDAEGDDRVIGFAQAVLDDGDEDHAAQLPRIYVHPDRWGEGVGSELLDRLETWLRERGAERLRLVVLADNRVGNAFYESRGYRTVGSRESEFEGETFTDYVREKEL